MIRVDSSANLEVLPSYPLYKFFKTRWIGNFKNIKTARTLKLKIMNNNSAFENFKENKEAYLIVSEIFNTISVDFKIEGIEKYNIKAFELVEAVSKK